MPGVSCSGRQKLIWHQESLEAKVVGVAVGLGLRYLLRCSLGKVGCRTFQMEPGSVQLTLRDMKNSAAGTQ